MALDESKENDSVFADRGITFIVEKELFETVKPINIDFTDSKDGAGFTIKSNLQKSGNCC